MIHKKAKTFILHEIQCLHTRLQRFYYQGSAGSKYGRAKLDWVTWLLGGEENLIYSYSVDDMNLWFQEVMVSLNYSALFFPTNTRYVPHNSNQIYCPDYFDSFFCTDHISPSSQLFAALQKVLLGYLAPDKAPCLYFPVGMQGNLIGTLIYFSRASDHFKSVDQPESLTPLRNPTILDNVEQCYRTFYQNVAQSNRENMLLYIYSPEGNEWYLSSGHGLVPTRKFTTRDEVSAARETVCNLFNSQGKLEPEATASSYTMADKANVPDYKVQQLKDLARNTRWQIADTRKYFVSGLIRERLGRSSGETHPETAFFDVLYHTFPFSAAILWEKIGGQWKIVKTMAYRSHPMDRRACTLHLSDEEESARLFDSVCFKYRQDLENDTVRVVNTLSGLKFNHKYLLLPVNTEEQNELMDKFGYSDQCWAGQSLNIQSHLIMPVKESDGPDLIVDLYLKSPAEAVEPLVYDFTRMISNLLVTTDSMLRIKKLQEKMSRTRYMGKLSHEIKNWFPEINRKLTLMTRIIEGDLHDHPSGESLKANLATVKTKTRYFNDIFRVILAEARTEKYPLHKERFGVDDMLVDVVQTVTEMCLYDDNFKRPVSDSFFPQGCESEEVNLEILLNEKIFINESGLSCFQVKTLVFVCIQEMMKNAVMNHDWTDPAGITISCQEREPDRLCITVTNSLKFNRFENIGRFCRALVHDADDRHEGFGTLWLKSIKEMIGAEFEVNPVWLEAHDKTDDARVERYFSLTVIFPKGEDN